MRPYQKPHPPVWIPGLLSKNTVQWCARNRIPYVMLSTRLEPTRQSFEYYDSVARECGYEAGTQHRGYLFKVHVDETEELAWQTARKFLEGPPNIFLEGSRGKVNPILQNLPGMTSRTELLPTREVFELSWSRGRQDVDRDVTRAIAPPVLSGLPIKAPETPEERATRDASYEAQLDTMSIITGTPETVIPKIRHVLETLRPGHIFFWDGDGAMTHDDAMRSIRLMGQEVIPAVREMARELELYDSFEIDPATNQPLVALPGR
jgi:alkanesulfonate monooxygenase SsuD/methylene tetrahydromethanopterin reductase-like flavin-dependent oxidoreductase (luciferase family)